METKLDTPDTMDTVVVPLTGFVRVPLPSLTERLELARALAEASADIRNGHYSVFDKTEFEAWMIADHPANVCK